MDPTQLFGFTELFTHALGATAKALCERNGETREHQFARTQAAVTMIMGFLPRDAIEAILAGHCVMFHELMLASTHDTLSGEVGTTRRATRSGIVAMDKCFHANLSVLERYQMRNAQGRRDAPAAEDQDQAMAAPPDAASTTEGPAWTPEGDAAADAPDARPPAEPRATRRFTPTPEAVAACLANKAAMAALNAGDAAGFARAMGVELPNEAYLAAAAMPGSPFDVGSGPDRAGDGGNVKERRPAAGD
jgi:hypothetical protein